MRNGWVFVLIIKVQLYARTQFFLLKRTKWNGMLNFLKPCFVLISLYFYRTEWSLLCPALICKICESLSFGRKGFWNLFLGRDFIWHIYAKWCGIYICCMQTWTNRWGHGLLMKCCTILLHCNCSHDSVSFPEQKHPSQILPSHCSMWRELCV